MGVDRNPRDSMKSTWRNDTSQWKLPHYMINFLNMHPTDITREVPVFQKDEKMPYIAVMDAHKWVGFHALWPLVVHQLYYLCMGHNPSPLATAIFYTLAFKINAIHEMGLMRNLGHRVGFLDGDKHERDQIPDHSVRKVMRSLVSTSTLRPFMSVYLTYFVSQPPTSMTWWWLPVEIGLYGLVLDFYYYWYHRALHEVEWLWQFHRTHHLTKHPNPLLTLYADGVQELFDIAGVPFATWATLRFLGLPMGFYDWWICHEYIVFTELWGHSGLRIFVTPPTTATPLLRLLNAELRTEDHDLHHRYGWKKSGNYGKQTLFWDRVFGTVRERIETIPSNIDWDNRVSLPIFYEFGF